MKLRLTGGGMWDNVEFDAAFAPQNIHLSGIVIDDEGIDLPPSLKKTVLMSRVTDQVYELDSFEGPNESIAVYQFQKRGRD